MAENSGQKTPPLRLEFEYRRAAGGGLSDTILLSLETRKPLRSLLQTSKSGKHGKRVYFVNPGKYIMYEVTRSGSGNIFINVKEVEVKADGNIEKLQEWELFRGDTISMLLSQLPNDIVTLLINNEKELPLFYEYMKQYKFLQG
jgi:hypothetical protein